ISCCLFFFSSRRRHTRSKRDWSSDVCSSDLADLAGIDWAARLREQSPTFDDGTGPVPPALLRRLATCGGIYRVLFSPEGEIINRSEVRRVGKECRSRSARCRERNKRRERERR